MKTYDLVYLTACGEPWQELEAVDPASYGFPGDWLDYDDVFPKGEDGKRHPTRGEILTAARHCVPHVAALLNRLSEVAPKEDEKIIPNPHGEGGTTNDWKDTVAPKEDADAE